MTRRKRVLIVDDDADFAEALRLGLEAAGYQALVAHTAAEAISIVRDTCVDVAVVDLMMEEMDSGVAVAYRLRRQPEMAHIPVILVTGVAKETGFRVPLETAEEREWLKVDAWLDKPVEVGRLIEEVERLSGG
jgi:CheY-like chemotaxis protein